MRFPGNLSHRSMIEQSTITCPHCGHRVTLRMPTDACLFFYDCTGCGEHLKPLPGDCCVFCSYGSVPCPPIQAQRMSNARAGSCCRGTTDSKNRGPGESGRLPPGGGPIL